MDPTAYFHQQVTPKKELPDFKAGDNITVYYKIVEGNKERIQAFRGEVIQRRGRGATQTFTVRKISNGIGVERVFPLYSPNIESIEVNKRGRVRRARLFYLRQRTGKKAKIREKRLTLENAGNADAGSASS
ncbi:MAG: 50S ribosomal protein L19 [Chitinophagales bacterium]|nr:50S ribosomal protein L19 [Chitinophagales bacterium]MDW8427904.1 50S ribosomal protein L19 [Chitinophagales bacterium]